MGLYECTVIGRQDLSTAQAEALHKEVNALIEANGGKIEKQEYWGLRTFTYRIKKNRKGHYLYSELSLEGEGLEEINRLMRLHEDILRFLIVRVEELEEGPSAMLLQKQRDEQKTTGDGPGRGGRDNNRDGNRDSGRDQGFRPKPRAA